MYWCDLPASAPAVPWSSMLRCFSFSSITPHFGPRVNIYARSASESFARLFKGGGVQGRSPCPRSAERGTLFMLIKDQERGLRGKPYQGVSPFSLRLYVCADTLGGSRWPVLRFDPISLVLAQRNGVEPPKKSAFLPRRLHHPRERYCLGGRDVPRPTWGRGLGGRPGAQVSLTQLAVMLGLRVRGRGGRD